MQIREFLNELLFYFPLSRKLEEEETKKLLETYVEDILYSINQWGSSYICDFTTLLHEIRTNYLYKQFPSIADIVSYLHKAKKIKPVVESYSGNEGQVIKRVINGIEYEFTVVPSHWEKIKTICELDYEINARTKKVG